MWAVLISSLALAASGEMVAETLDGRTIEGTVQQISASGAVLAGAEGPVKIAAEQILSLRAKSAATPAAETPPITIELIDRSVVAARDFTVSDGRATVQTSAEQSIEIPTKSITIARFKPETAVTKPQWARILSDWSDGKLRGDVLVIRKGENVDAIEGVFYNVSTKDGKKVLDFEYDDEKLPVNFDRVDGMLYFHGTKPKFSAASCVASSSDGSTLHLKTIDLADGKLTMETLAGVKVTGALDQFKSFDFSAGKLMYLAAGDDGGPGKLAPLRAAVWTPGVATSDSEFNRLTLPQVNLPRSRHYWDNIPGRDELRVAGDKRAYTRGLMMRGETMVEYALRGEYRQFQAVVGMHNVGYRGGVVQLQIVADDDRVLYNHVFRGSDKQPEVLKLDVSDVRRLQIRTMRKNSSGDYLNLCDAKVTK